MDFPDDPGRAGDWTKAQREARAMSAAWLAKRINGLARQAGDPTIVSQQVISKFEQGNTKRMPAWARFVAPALSVSDGEMREAPHLSMASTDDTVSVRRLPNFVGMGPGGSDEDEPGVVAFSRDLVERELRAPADVLLAMVAEGNSMEPEFRGGDQILVDTRRKSLAQPGAFCLWDGDGHVIKFLERIQGSEPPKVRVISANGGIYEPCERLVEEINLVGRVVWFGRRVQ
jgi:phage repressor protein C with HTH and peptisase S24 domain